MNRREAIAALVALPEVSRISVAKPQPDDVIVVESERPISEQGIENIKACVERIWPGRQVVVLSDGLTLKFAGK